MGYMPGKMPRITRVCLVYATVLDILGRTWQNKKNSGMQSLKNERQTNIKMINIKVINVIVSDRGIERKNDTNDEIFNIVTFRLIVFF